MEAKNDAFEDVGTVVNFLANYLHKINFFLSYTSAVLNLFHLLILTRKSMKTTSTNVIMLGIAMSDLFTMLATIYKHYQLVDVENPECVSSTSELKMYMNTAAWCLQDHFRRCSTWLGVSMASVRVLIMRKSADKRHSGHSKPRFGWILVIGVFCISGVLSAFYQSRFRVISGREVPLPLSCSEYQDIEHPPEYTLILNALFSFENQIVLRVYLMFDAIVTKFIPCVAFPMLTVLLLRELRKVRESRASGRKVSGAVHNTTSSEEKNDLTTRLIIFMTVSFFIAEAPLGGIYIVKAFSKVDDPVRLFSVDFIIYFTVLLTLNSISHPVFCVFMSSQYRDTIRRLLGLHRSKLLKSSTSARGGNKTSVVSIH